MEQDRQQLTQQLTQEIKYNKEKSLYNSVEDYGNLENILESLQRQIELLKQIIESMEQS